MLDFVTPKNWVVGDDIIMQINRSPHDIEYIDGKLVLIRPPEPPNGWEREFYSLHNKRTKDWVTVDFDQVEGFENLKR